MRVTVLGSSASYSGPARACAGHFVEAAGSRVLFDCGNGVVANLAQIEDPTALDAVFVTHNHPDHYADVFTLHAALQYAPGGPRGPIPLYTPPGLADTMKQLLSERGARSFDEAFVAMPLVADVPIAVGDLTVTPIPVQHTDPTFALVARADGVAMTYSADTEPCDGVLRAAQGVDLLVAEATLPEEYAGAGLHMTASEAGRLARQVGARGLVLVHVWPTNDREQMTRLASEAFGAPVRVAEEFDSFEIIAPGEDTTR
jgi:ribonuclease BN (tRNA processing enzyme)